MCQHLTYVNTTTTTTTTAKTKNYYYYYYYIIIQLFTHIHTCLGYSIWTLSGMRMSITSNMYIFVIRRAPVSKRLWGGLLGY